MAEQEDYPILHIYEQPSHHMDAYIFGNRLGLEALRDAINQALTEPEPEAAQVSQNDGECYDLVVRCASTSWAKLIRTNYTDFPYDPDDDERKAFMGIYNGLTFEPEAPHATPA